MFSPLALLNALAPTIVTAVAPGARATHEAIPVSEAVMVTIEHGLPVVTQDADFDQIARACSALSVIKV
jgi:hypothetical protein